MSFTTSTLVLGACIIAAIRLSRVENLLNSPTVALAISDSVDLARQVLAKVVRAYR